MNTEKLLQEARRARKKMGLSQEAIAHRAGVTLFTYHQFEKGNISPRMSTLLKIMAALELNLTLDSNTKTAAAKHAA